MQQKIINHVLNNTTYSGNKEPGVKQLSASMISRPLLQLYLDFKFGKQEQHKIEQSTIGTLMHSGLEEIFKDYPDVKLEQKFKHKMDNGWYISGSVDALFINEKYIVDWKLIKDSILKDLARDGMYHPYAIQLAIYRFLVKQELGIDAIPALTIFNKKASYFKPTPTDSFYFVEPDVMDEEELVEYINDTIAVLEEVLASDEVPDKCENIFWYKQKGKKFKSPITCMYYCSYSNNCPYYNKSYNEQNKLINIANKLEPEKKEILDEYDF